MVKEWLILCSSTNLAFSRLDNCPLILLAIQRQGFSKRCRSISGFTDFLLSLAIQCSLKADSKLTTGEPSVFKPAQELSNAVARANRKNDLIRLKQLIIMEGYNIEEPPCSSISILLIKFGDFGFCDFISPLNTLISSRIVTNLQSTHMVVFA